MKKIHYNFMLIVMSILIVGCSRKPYADPLDENNTQQWPQSVYQSQLDNLNKKEILNQPDNLEEAQERLSKDGVELITMGQDYLLIIPSRLLFYENSPRIQWNSYKILNDVTNFLRFYRPVSLQVNGYTNDAGIPMRNRALSFAQAKNVMRYLSRQGVDSRLIYAQGYGEAKPMYAQTNVDNARIELAFRNVII